jgi:hypothetical protein
MNQKISSIIALTFIVVYAGGFLLFINESEKNISVEVNISATNSPAVKKNAASDNTTEVANDAESQKTGNKICKDQCGNGVCQEVVCQSIGCPCPETIDSCSEDCVN